MMQGLPAGECRPDRGLQTLSPFGHDRSHRSIGDQYSAQVFDKDAPASRTGSIEAPGVTESRVGAQRFIKVAAASGPDPHLRQYARPRIPHRGRAQYDPSPAALLGTDRR